MTSLSRYYVNSLQRGKVISDHLSWEARGEKCWTHQQNEYTQVAICPIVAVHSREGRDGHLIFPMNRKCAWCVLIGQLRNIDKVHFASEAWLYFQMYFIKNTFLKTEKKNKIFYAISQLLNKPFWVLKYVLQELLELPYITWTEKPESTTRWSFKPKTWLGKSEGFQAPPRSTSPWLTSTTTPHAFLRVRTCSPALNVILFLYIKQNEMLASIAACYCYLKFNILFLCHMVSLL